MWETAQTGEGKVDSVTTDKPDQRMATSTVTGNISDIDAYLTATEKFTFRSRMYIIRSVSEPRSNGKYVEGTVEATSYFLVDSGPF